MIAGRNWTVAITLRVMIAGKNWTVAITLRVMIAGKNWTVTDSPVLTNPLGSIQQFPGRRRNVL